MRIFLDEPQVIETVAHVLEDAISAAGGASTGPVQLRLLSPGLPGEVEMELGRHFPVNPQIKGAIKSLDGVLSVEDI